MATQAKAGAFNIGTGAATTQVQVTGVGFQPAVVIFFWSGAVAGTDTVAGGNLNAGFGFASSATSRRSVGSFSLDGNTDSDVRAGNRDDACICQLDAAGFVGLADFVSLDADGFTLVIDDQFPTDLRIGYLALAGDAASSVFIGQYDTTTTTGNLGVTGVGFQPECLIQLISSVATSSNASTASLEMGIGFATAATQRGTANIYSADGQATSVTRRYLQDAECLARGSGGQISTRLDLVSFDADGFTVNRLEVSQDRRVYFLALAGGDYRVATLLTQTDTETEIVTSSWGFEPVGALFLSHGAAESTQDAAQNDAMLSVGAASGATSRVALACSDQNALADTECAHAVEHDAVYARLDLADGIAGLMDLQSFDADGLTCIMDDADPDQAAVVVLGFGPAEAGGLTVNLPLASMALTAQALTVDAGLTVNLPLASMAMTAGGGLGLAQTLPIATTSFSAQALGITLGGDTLVALPLASMTMQALIPLVAPNALLPLATMNMQVLNLLSPGGVYLSGARGRAPSSTNDISWMW